MTTYRPAGSDNFEPVNQRKQFTAGQILNGEIEEIRKTVKYPEYLAPTAKEEIGKFRRFTNPDHAVKDRGHFGTKDFKHLFPKGREAYNQFDLTPELGTEVLDESVQLSKLDAAGKDDLALFLETRGVAVFRNQDFRDQGPKFATEFGKYFGPLHVHPVAFSAKGYPELLTTFRKAGGDERYAPVYEDTTKTFRWHSDVAFEPYPPSFSFFVGLEAPPSGGDTIFIDLREAYRRLSPTVQTFFELLSLIHSNVYQNKLAASKDQPQRVNGDLFTKHPLVRVHPVTGEKLLWFVPGFTQRVDGVKRQESDAILNFLVDHVQNNPEFQVRALHRGGDSRLVIAWDNRILLHLATLDFLRHETGHRHHFRITVLGEKPYNEVIGDGDGNKDAIPKKEDIAHEERKLESVVDGKTKSGEVV